MGSVVVRFRALTQAAILLLVFPGAAKAHGVRGALADSLVGFWGDLSARAEPAVLAVSLDRGDTLLALEEAKRRIPASNAKLFTTGAFLQRYGPDHRVPTILSARGKVSRKDGGRRVRFTGDLVLRGSGMPDVEAILRPGSRGLLDSVAVLLRSGGLEKFEGTLWVDGSRFAPEPYPPGWAQDDLAHAYGAPVNAVLANGNAVSLVASAAQDAREVELHFEPPEAPLLIHGRPTLAAAGAPAQLVVRRAPGSRVLEVSGSIPRGGAARRQVAVTDPDSTAGLMLLGAMKRAGVEVEARVRVLPARPEDEGRRAREVAPLYATVGSASAVPPAGPAAWERVRRDRVADVLALDSPPAAEVIAAVNAVSLNPEAEALLRLLDPAPTGKTREGGLAEVYRFAGRAGVDTLDLSLVDGSGLSPMNLVTARAIVTWLTALERDPAVGPAFREGLGRPGATGTLKNRFAALSGRETIRGKTGSLTNVSSMSGFVTSAGGERIVFSILSNGNRGSIAPARALEERIVELLASFRRPAPVFAPPLGIPR